MVIVMSVPIENRYLSVCPFVRLSDFWSNDIILYDLSLCPFVPFFVNEGQERCRVERRSTFFNS